MPSQPLPRNDRSLAMRQAKAKFDNLNKPKPGPLAGFKAAQKRLRAK